MQLEIIVIMDLLICMFITRCGPFTRWGVETFFTREGVRIFMSTFQMIIIYFFQKPFTRNI